MCRWARRVELVRRRPLRSGLIEGDNRHALHEDDRSSTTPDLPAAGSGAASPVRGRWRRVLQSRCPGRCTTRSTRRGDKLGAVTELGRRLDIFRTPDERFADLQEYPFRPCHQYWQGLRMHYVDEGRGTPVLLLHGEPTWSYLYRSMIPPLVAAGFRCVAPDYIGFGKSDKVLDDAWYVIERHVESIRSLIEALDLRDITLVVHDWGGPIGLRQAVDMPERVSRLVILNTWLHHHGFHYSDMIRRWRSYALGFAPGTGDMPTGEIVARWPRIDEGRRSAVKAAYDAPYPDAASKAGPRRFPWCLPFAEPLAGNAADQARCFEAITQWQKPAHLIFGDRDEIFSGDWARAWAAEIPGATVDMVPGPHHVSEESGPTIAGLMLKYMTARDVT